MRKITKNDTNKKVNSIYKSIQSIASQLNKSYEGTRVMSDTSITSDVKHYLSTGIHVLNKEISGTVYGGFPSGRVAEIYGAESSGKTTLIQSIFANLTNNNGSGLYLDTECALDKKRSCEIGVDLDRVIYATPSYLEEGFRMIEDTASIVTEKLGNIPFLIGFDSIAGTPCKAELDGDYEDSNVGTHARALSKAMRKLTSIISKTNIALIFINQVRDKIGVMYGDKISTFGGRAIKFHSSVRIEIARKEKKFDKETKQPIGILSHAQVTKNKIAAPFGYSEVHLNFRKKNVIDNIPSVFEYMLRKGLIEQSGSWYSCKELSKSKFQLKAFRDIFKENKKTVLEMIDSVE